ncbi:MAG: hypothetical protein ACO3UU_03605 [Minisyncoccia bacterium]
MTKYKVYGDKLMTYYTIVTADSQEQAWEFAANNDNLDWFQVEDDASIEPYDVQLEEDETNLLEDGYPSMANEILIMDKTDI